MTNRPSKANCHDAETQVEILVFEYLRRQGKIIPQTPEDVARAEAWLLSKRSSAPERLRSFSPNAPSPCASIRTASKTPLMAPNGTAQNLARAAREGKAISPQVSEQMRRDREEAERGKNGNP